MHQVYFKFLCIIHRLLDYELAQYFRILKMLTIVSCAPDGVRPWSLSDMTFAVDWALKTNDLSIYPKLESSDLESDHSDKLNCVGVSQEGPWSNGKIPGLSHQRLTWVQTTRYAFK